MDKRKQESLKRHAEADQLKAKLGVNAPLSNELLSKPCECDKRIIGACVPCAMRNRVKAGESVSEVLKDYGYR